jgi:hypothetical protein
MSAKFGQEKITETRVYQSNFSTQTETFKERDKKL